jgi:CubicO group peptidase (beta-lactamase class C family)
MASSATPERSRQLRALLQDAVERRIAPAAVAEIGDTHGVVWREAFGRLTFDSGAARTTEHTIFDLASLTKPVATTSLVLARIARHQVSLEERVAGYFPEWTGDSRESATIQDLLEHAAGLPARLLERPPEGRREFEHDICATPLEYPVRSRSIYSDLGFILLGFLLEDLSERSLAAQFDEVLAALTSTAPFGANECLAYGVRAHRRASAAPTLALEEDKRRGRVLAGEVHDNYAAALGGAAGHAGLFGTAGALGTFARLVLRAATGDKAVPAPLSPALVTRATRPSTVPGSSRALGWDTMRPTSSCGPSLSTAAFGHVGFTGTSLWIDPQRDRYFVLLTNRVCGGGSSDQMQALRRAFHTLAATI